MSCWWFVKIYDNIFPRQKHLCISVKNEAHLCRYWYFLLNALFNFRLLRLCTDGFGDKLIIMHCELIGLYPQCIHTDPTDQLNHTKKFDRQTRLSHCLWQWHTWPLNSDSDSQDWNWKQIMTLTYTNQCKLGSCTLLGITYVLQPFECIISNFNRVFINQAQKSIYLMWSNIDCLCYWHNN